MEQSFPAAPQAPDKRLLTWQSVRCQDQLAMVAGQQRTHRQRRKPRRGEASTTDLAFCDWLESRRHVLLLFHFTLTGGKILLDRSALTNHDASWHQMKWHLKSRGATCILDGDVGCVVLTWTGVDVAGDMTKHLVFTNMALMSWLIADVVAISTKCIRYRHGSVLFVYSVWVAGSVSCRPTGSMDPWDDLIWVRCVWPLRADLVNQDYVVQLARVSWVLTRATIQVWPTSAW